MKVMRLLGCAWLALVGAVPMLQADVIQISEMDEMAIQQFTKGQLRDVTIECKEGTCLPFHLDVKGDFLSAGSSAIPLTILKTCYMRCANKEEFLFSSDQKEWKSFSDFFTGKLNISIHAEQGVLRAGMEITLNRR